MNDKKELKKLKLNFKIENETENVGDHTIIHFNFLKFCRLKFEKN